MKKSWKTVITIFLSCLLLFLVACGKGNIYKNHTELGVEILKLYESNLTSVYDRAVYVSNNGSDDNDGSLDYPVKSINCGLKKAMDNKAKTLVLTQGVYHEGITVQNYDTALKIVGLGDVSVVGSKTIPSSAFEPLSGWQRDCINTQIADNIKQVDLFGLGITESQLRVYAVGWQNVSKQYSTAEYGTNLGLYQSDVAFDMARYPNEGFVKVNKIVKQQENTSVVKNGGAFSVDSETATRIKNWNYLDNIFIHGYPYWDWADQSSPVTVDKKEGVVYPKYHSSYGQKEDVPYFFYNVLCELDRPGEYYIDAESGKLIFYPISNDNLEIAVDNADLITVTNSSNLTLRGFSVKNVRGNGITVKGDNNTLYKLDVKNIVGDAVNIKGYNNTVSSCEIHEIGKAGIIIDGGDRRNLLASENVVKNNCIHDFAKFNFTYSGGIKALGVNCLVAHNEIFNTPHTAIFYEGNDHVIEYNYIHDTVLHSKDAGAIYSGRSWSWYGNVIRYNLIENTGTDEYPANGIYFDDALSGQEAYGNIIVNTKGYSFLIGSGHDIKVYNNVIYNESNLEKSRGLYFDDRSRQKTNNEFRYLTKFPVLWDSLDENNMQSGVPYTNYLWKAIYPELAKIIINTTNYDDPYFPINPARDEFKNNIEINTGDWYMGKSIMTFNTVEDIYRIWYKTPEEIGFNVDTYTFNVLPENFTEIPVQEIGIRK